MTYYKNFFNEKNYNLFIYIFLFSYLVLGIFLSVGTGITADEFIEQRNWISKLDLIKSYFEENKLLETEGPSWNWVSNAIFYCDKFFKKLI